MSRLKDEVARTQQPPQPHPDRFKSIQDDHRRVKFLLAGVVGLVVVGFSALSMKWAGEAPAAANVGVQAAAATAPPQAAPSPVAAQTDAFMAELKSLGAACQLAGDNVQRHLDQGSVQEAYSWSMAAQDACDKARAAVLTQLKPPEAADAALKDEFAHVIDTCAARFEADIKTYDAMAKALDGGMAPSQVERAKDLLEWSNVRKGSCESRMADTVTKAGATSLS